MALHLRMDGSTDVVNGKVGASAHAGGHVAACSYGGSFTGSELGEHLGVACALKCAHESQVAGRAFFFVLHIDSANCLARYDSSGFMGFADAFRYLQFIWDRNKERIRCMEAMGCSFDFRKIDRRANATADGQAKRVLREAVKHGVLRPLTTDDGQVDESVRQAADAASAILRALRTLPLQIPPLAPAIAPAGLPPPLPTAIAPAGVPPTPPPAIAPAGMPPLPPAIAPPGVLPHRSTASSPDQRSMSSTWT
jgi:hypothetical protein